MAARRPSVVYQLPFSVSGDIVSRLQRPALPVDFLAEPLEGR
jgi:hypothetical protein